MFLSDKNNIKEVLLFPAMKPDASAGAGIDAGRRLAASVRAAENRAAAVHEAKHAGGAAGGGGAGAAVPSASAGAGIPSPAAAGAPQLVAPLFARLDAELAGRPFLGGERPSVRDAAEFDRVAAAGGLPAAAGLGALRRWYDTCAIFSTETRRAWS
jgi:glutathione S-transferase